MRTDIKKATAYAQEAYTTSLNGNNVQGQIKALNLLGYSYIVIGDYQKAVSTELKALKLSEQVKDTAGLIES